MEHWLAAELMVGAKGSSLESLGTPHFPGGRYPTWRAPHILQGGGSRQVVAYQPQPCINSDCSLLQTVSRPQTSHFTTSTTTHHHHNNNHRTPDISNTPDRKRKKKKKCPRNAPPPQPPAPEASQPSPPSPPTASPNPTATTCAPSAKQSATSTATWNSS